MSLAYLILTHHKPRQFARLFDALYHPADRFLIHVDRKAPLAIRDAIARHVRGKPNVHHLQSRRITWGGWSVSEVQLDGIRALLARDKGWRWFVNLSGQDFPLKRRDTILAELQATPERNHIHCKSFDEFPEADREHLRWRLRHRFIEQNGDVMMAPGTPDRPADVTVWKGSAWWTLTRAFCEWVVHDTLARKMSASLRESFIADEFLMQTLAMNGAFAGTVGDDNRRLIRFTPGAAHPDTLTMSDSAVLLDSPAHYARKFDEDVDAGILDLLAGRVKTSA